jgi:serine/threonine protein phosphatase 1
MAITYVIPDIHGRADLLRDGLAGIAAHARSRIGTIVALGDYVDKGPDNKAVIDLLRGDPAPGWPFIALKGNHDAMMVEALRNPSKCRDRVVRWCKTSPVHPSFRGAAKRRALMRNCASENP